MAVRNSLKNILKMTHVGEVSLVGDGDNPGADVLILKMRDAVHVPTDTVMDQFGDFAEHVASLYELAAGRQGAEGVEQASAILKGLGMTIEELQQKLETVEGSLESVTKERDALKGQVDTLTSERDTAKADLDTVTKERDTLKAAGPGKGADEDDVLKGLPENIRKRLDDADKVAKAAQDEVTKLRDERERESFIAKARELGVTEKEVEPVGELLQRVSKGKSEPKDADKIVEILTIAKNVGDAGNALFTAIGKASGTDAAEGVEAQQKLDEAIAKLRTTDKDLTYEQAYDRVICDPANASLYEEVKKIRPQAKAA